MSAASVPRLNLTVTEQPAKLHRFRYLKEIRDGRMGSILHGRSSQKTPVKVEVTAVGDGVESRCPMKLVGCTVFDDQAPHPFYLFGDDCSGGVFEKEFSLTNVDESKCEVSLDRIGIVAAPKKQSVKGHSAGGGDTRQEQEDGSYEDRISRWNFFHKPTVSHPFRRDVNKLMLAFQVFVQLPDSQQLWTPADCTPVVTELILNAKMHSELSVECVIPKVVFRPDQDIWLYTKDPLPAGAWLTGSVRQFKVMVENRRGEVIFDLPVKSLKKHLVVFDFLNVKLPDDVELVSVRVADLETGAESEPVNLELRFTSPEQEPARKRSKHEGIVGIDSLAYLLSGRATPGEDSDSAEDLLTELILHSDTPWM